MSVELRVEVQKTVRVPVPPGFLRGVLAAAADQPEVSDRLLGPAPELTVRIAGDRTLRRLNREFLGEDRPTDVLSFPSGDRTAGYLGDLAVSWPAVVRQAGDHGHSEEVELAVLTVHGLLHLLGWDHASARDEREMTRLTLACLVRAEIFPAAGSLRDPS